MTERDKFDPVRLRQRIKKLAGMARRRRRKADYTYPANWKDELGREQQWKCIYCSRSMTKERTLDGREVTFEHLLPRSRGGRTRRKNLALSCSRCNTAKGSMTDAEYRIAQAIEAAQPAIPQGSTERESAVPDKGCGQ